ncbi:10355_t:CDS:1, partial [Dentiscutata erythropus]
MSFNDNTSINDDVFTSNNNNITISNYEKESILTTNYQRTMSFDDNISINNDIFTNYENSSNNNITISNYKEKPILTTNYQETISLDDDNISTASNYEELILYEIFNSNSHNNEDEDQEYISKFMIKLYIKEQNRIAFLAKRLSFNAQSYMEFHEEMQLQIQSLTNNFKLNQKDYILAYKVTQETGIETQITNEDDFVIFTTKQKEVFIIATMLSNISITSNK